MIYGRLSECGVYCIQFNAYTNGVKGVEEHCLNFGMQTLWKKKKELNGSEKTKFKQSVEGNGDNDDDSVGSQYLLINICCVLATVLNPVYKLFNPHITL